MTQLQETEFEILKAFDAVCRKLDLPYFLVCGSALGAVKYGGFIPWDDDIDVAMYREDYEVFLREAGNYLPDHLFLQNHHTEPAFPQIYSKLRNSATTYIEKSAQALPINHGVFLDIFPLDGYPDSRGSQRLLEIKKRLFLSMANSVYTVQRSPAGKLACLVWKLLRVNANPAAVAGWFERAIVKYPPGTSDVLCNHGNWQGQLDYFPAEGFGEGAWMRFEGLQVRVPARYSVYLTRKYGDYLQDPPEEDRNGHHHYTVCDCQKPYTAYIGKTGDVRI